MNIHATSEIETQIDKKIWISSYLYSITKMSPLNALKEADLAVTIYKDKLNDQRCVATHPSKIERGQAYDFPED